MTEAILIPKGECALVSNNDMTELELYVPNLPDDVELPPLAQFLVACCSRFHQDPDFVQAQLDWLDNDMEEETCH